MANQKEDLTEAIKKIVSDIRREIHADERFAEKILSHRGLVEGEVINTIWTRTNNPRFDALVERDIWEFYYTAFGLDGLIMDSEHSNAFSGLGSRDYLEENVASKIEEMTGLFMAGEYTKARSLADDITGTFSGAKQDDRPKKLAYGAAVLMCVDIQQICLRLEEMLVHVPESFRSRPNLYYESYALNSNFAAAAQKALRTDPDVMGSIIGLNSSYDSRQNKDEIQGAINSFFVEYGIATRILSDQEYNKPFKDTGIYEALRLEADKIKRAFEEHKFDDATLSEGCEEILQTECSVFLKTDEPDEYIAPIFALKEALSSMAHQAKRMSELTAPENRQQ